MLDPLWGQGNQIYRVGFDGQQMNLLENIAETTGIGVGVHTVIIRTPRAFPAPMARKTSSRSAICLWERFVYDRALVLVNTKAPRRLPRVPLPPKLPTTKSRAGERHWGVGNMPASMVLTLSDPYEYQRSVNAGSFDLVVTAAGPYLGKLERLELHSLWMQRSWQRLPHLARASPTANRAPIAFLVGNDHPPSVFGSELRPGRIAVLPMGEEHYHRVSNEFLLGRHVPSSGRLSRGRKDFYRACG